jgi:hypothetical protein
MALLLILIALFGFVFAGFGSGSSGSSGSSSSSSSTTVAPTVLKCSKRMSVKPTAAKQRRCGPPPASP